MKREELESYWMPFTANRYFKENPIMVTKAEGSYLYDASGKKYFDGLSGLWCCGLGHGRSEIVEAVSHQIKQMDYAPPFQVAHPLAFQVANKLTALMPEGLDYAFFTNSGSEAVDTALKMARGYWRQKGMPSKTRLIGRSRGYHGVNFGGMSVGGIGGNRKIFGAGLETDHLRHTWLAENAFSRGMPEHGADLANELEELVALHDASNIAAVIVEPMAGSTGVIPPPVGYLNRLRELCDKHNILLIFDEVICGFGRMGAKTGAEAFGVKPDIMTLAKGLTNGTIPMGAVVAKADIYNTYMAAGGAEHMVEFAHGYTYSAHPVACAASLAALDLFETDKVVDKVNALAPHFEDCLHQFKGHALVEDIRNLGLAGSLQIKADNGDPAIRPFKIFRMCWEQGVYVRCGGNTIQLAPPFNATKEEIDHLFNVLGDAINKVDSWSI